MIKTILKYFALMLSIGLVGFVVVWANMQSADTRCSDVIVKIVNTDTCTFISEKVILDDFRRLGFNLRGKPIKDVDYDAIEKAIGSLDYIESVQSYSIFDKVDVDKVIPDRNYCSVIIEARQFKPVMRVFNKKGKSYYVNRAGKKMKANVRYRADVPVVYGEFDSLFKETYLLPLVDFIAENPKRRQYTSALKAVNERNIILLPSIKGHVVNFGDTSNLSGKFQKLRKFYKEVMPVKGWLAYDTVAVKWDYQIVATKRNKKKCEDFKFGPEDDEVPPDAEMIENLANAGNPLDSIFGAEKQKDKNLKKQK